MLTSLKTRKQQRIKENSSLGVKVKVDLMDEAISYNFVSKVKKIKLREEKGSVKSCVLDSNNRDVGRDSSDESETKESLD